MSQNKPSRRDLLRPVQLLGFAFGAAAFAAAVTLVVMGGFQRAGGEQVPRALTVTLVIAGITFIVTLVSLALLMLIVDPAQVERRIDRPVLLPDEPVDPDSPAPADGTSPPRT